MARPLGLLVFVGLALSSIAWSLTNLPEPTVTLAYADDPVDGTRLDGTGLDGTGPDGTAAQGATRPDLVDVLAQAGFESRQEMLVPSGPGLETGIYRVVGLEPATTKQRKTAASGSTTKGTGSTKTAKGTTTTKSTGKKAAVVAQNGPAREAPTPENVELHVEGATGPTTPPVDRGEIRPGLYATAFDATGCSYQLTRIMSDRRIAVIGEDSLADGRLLANINEIEPDWFTSSSGCGAWYVWTPLAVPLTRAGNGDYWVGDLAKGVWPLGAGCRWEKVVSFRGAVMHDVVAYGSGVQPLIVDDNTYGVRVRGCHGELTLDAKATEQWVADEAVRAELGLRGDDGKDRTKTTAATEAKAKPKAKRKPKATTTTVAPVESTPAPEPAPEPAPAPEPTPAPAPDPAPTSAPPTSAG